MKPKVKKRRKHKSEAGFTPHLKWQKIKPLRILYTVIIVSSIGLGLMFYWQYHLRDEQLVQYQRLYQLFSREFTDLNTRLAQTKNELETSLQKIGKLDKVIAALEEEKIDFQGELQVLREERARHQVNISKLTEEKNILEQKHLSLEKKFHSLEELKKAIRIVKIEQRQRDKIEKVQRHLAKIEMLKKYDEVGLQYGNRGYLVRSAASTFKPTRIRVELERIGTWSYREIENK